MRGELCAACERPVSGTMPSDVCPWDSDQECAQCVFDWAIKTATRVEEAQIASGSDLESETLRATMRELGLALGRIARATTEHADASAAIADALQEANERARDARKKSGKRRKSKP